jgi:hypothetical protein
MVTIIDEDIGGGNNDYATIGAWKTAHDRDDLTAAGLDVIYRGNVYTGTHSDDVQVVFNEPLHSTVTDATHYRWLRAAPGHEYNPIANTGYRHTITTKAQNFRIIEPFVRITGIGMLQQRVTPITLPPVTRCVRIDRECTIERCHLEMTHGANDLGSIIEVTADLTEISPGVPRTPGGPVYLDSLVLEGSGNSGAAVQGPRIGVNTFAAGAAAEIRVQNVVVYNVTKGSTTLPAVTLGIGFIYDAEAAIHNDTITDSSPLELDYFQNGVPRTASHNASGDTSAPPLGGTGPGAPLTSQVTADLYARANQSNFRPKPPSSNLIDAGTDLSGSWHDQTAVQEFEGDTWKVQWEIGAYQYPEDVDEAVGGWRGVVTFVGGAGVGVSPGGTSLASGPGSAGVTRSPEHIGLVTRPGSR